MKSLRLISAATLIAMLSATIIGCSGSNTATETSAAESDSTVSESSADESATEAETTAASIEAPAVVDYDGYVYNIFGCTMDFNEYFDTTSENGDPINDEVYKRNRKIEELYGIEISDDHTQSAYDNGPVIDRLVNNVLADTYFADLYTNLCFQTLSLCCNNNFKNIYDIESINLDAPYWDKTFIDSLTMNDHAYMMTGDIQCNDEMHLIVWTVNLKLFGNSYSGDNIYDIVNNGEWTYDKLYNYCNGWSQDINGDGAYDNNDVVGCVTNMGCVYN